MKPSNKSKFFVSTIVLALVGVIAAEWFAREKLGLGDPPLYVQDDEIGYLIAPNQDLVRRGKRILVNEYSMRSEPLPDPSNKEVQRILVLGDSIAHGGIRTSHEHLASTRLWQLMPDRNVFVANLSADNWGPRNWLGYLERYGSFNADTVFIVASSDTLTVNPFALANGSQHPTEKPFSALSELIFRYILPTYLPALAPHDCPAEEPSADMYDQLALLRPQDYMVQVGNFLSTRPTKLHLLIWPEAAELESTSRHPLFRSFANVCEQGLFNCISMHEEIRSAARDGIQVYIDGFNPNEEGQRLIAERMAKTLLAQAR